MKAVVSVVLAVLTLSLAPVASAGVETNEWFHFDAQTIACGGETIDVAVDVHVVARVSRDGNGVAHLGSVSTTFFRGTSETGAPYVGAAHSTTQLRGDVGAETTHTETFHQTLIHVGEDRTAEDLHGRAVNHFTINAIGRLVVDKFEFISACK